MKRNFHKAILIFSLTLLCGVSLTAQNSSAATKSTAIESNTVSLPNGYSTISLGMSVDDVKAALLDNPQFGYRGDRDVSMLPGENRVLIETDASLGNSFLDRCWFQFYQDKLYIITIGLNQKKMDHYSVFSTLCKKYGNPGTLDPEKATWQNDTVIMSLERPLTLKYTDRTVFNKLQDQSLVNKSGEEVSRDTFLEGL